MPGEIKRLIDSIVEKRSQGNPTLVTTTRTKLVLKGIDVDKFTSLSDDDPAVIDKLKKAAVDLGIRL